MWSALLVAALAVGAAVLWLWPRLARRPESPRRAGKGGDPPPIPLGDLRRLAADPDQGPILEPTGEGPERPARGDRTDRESAADGGRSEPMIVAVTVMSRPEAKFTGPRVVAALGGLDLAHGRMGLFHHFGGARGAHLDGGERPVFSVANVLEPGSFDLDRIGGVVTPGLTLFAELPGPLEGPLALELMLDIGRRLARELDGDLCDARRSTLTAQGILALRDRVVEHAAGMSPVGPPRERHAGLDAAPRLGGSR